MFDLGKAMEMKKQMEAISKRLDTITVEGLAGSGERQVSATFTANRAIRNIRISPALLQPESKEELEDLLVLASEKAIQQAQQVAETEARNLALGGGFPGI